MGANSPLRPVKAFPTQSPRAVRGSLSLPWPWPYHYPFAPSLNFVRATSSVTPTKSKPRLCDPASAVFRSIFFCLAFVSWFDPCLIFAGNREQDVANHFLPPLFLIDEYKGKKQGKARKRKARGNTGGGIRTSRTPPPVFPRAHTMIFSRASTSNFPCPLRGHSARNKLPVDPRFSSL